MHYFLPRRDNTLGAVGTMSALGGRGRGTTGDDTYTAGVTGCDNTLLWSSSSCFLCAVHLPLGFHTLSSVATTASSVTALSRRYLTAVFDVHLELVRLGLSGVSDRRRGTVRICCLRNCSYLMVDAERLHVPSCTHHTKVLLLSRTTTKHSPSCTMFVRLWLECDHPENRRQHRHTHYISVAFPRPRPLPAATGTTTQ